MAHALVTQVSLEGRDPATAEKLLNEQVIPAVKGLAGFDRGVWLRSADGSTGMGIVVFDSEEHARAAEAGMGALRPPDAPPITSSVTYIVTGIA
jgi:hypothetical protein